MNTAQTLTRQQISEMYESACAFAARLYEQGEDTTKADAECDRLQALLEEQA